MATEKLVDDKFLARLLASSYESAMGAAVEAVAENKELFGVRSESDLSVVGTFTDHIIVATRSGAFYRCEWSISEDGDVTISDVKSIDVPFIEGDASAAHVRKVYSEAVDAILECRTETAEEKLKELLDLTVKGVPMTAEQVEILFVENKKRFSESDWITHVREKDAAVRQFLGAEALTINHPRARFAEMIGESVNESVAEDRRKEIVGAMGELHKFLVSLNRDTALAREVNESYRPRRGSVDDKESVADFVVFVRSFTEDLDGMISIVEDAMSVVEDGCAKCIARLHDNIAGQMREWAVGAMFAAKLARQFEAPKAT
jgi:hypothetical protein